MIIGGPFAFLAGLFCLGAAGVGELARDAKIKAGTPSLNEYGRCKRNNIANFDEGHLKRNLEGFGPLSLENWYDGGLDWKKIAKDFAEQHSFKYSDKWWECDQSLCTALLRLYYDRIFTLAGIETNAFYKARDHMKYFTDPQWRIEDYDYLSQIPIEQVPKFGDKGVTLGEAERLSSAWHGIRCPQQDLDLYRSLYVGPYTNLKIPAAKIQFLEEVVEQKEDEVSIVG